MVATDRKQQIDVYVRLDESEKGRELSFRIPDDITQKEILDSGYAIDGNQVLIGVSAYVEQGTGRVVTLAEALRDLQQELVEWLGTTWGYTVVFK
jgi:hypothetical protein